MECPLCGDDTPHGHTQEFIADWLRAQGQTYQFKGRVLPPFNESDLLQQLRTWCQQHPSAYGEQYALLFRALNYLEDLESRGAAVLPAPSFVSRLRAIRDDIRRRADHAALIDGWVRFAELIDNTIYEANEAGALRTALPSPQLDPIQGLRAAKYLNPECAENGCQWLKADPPSAVLPDSKEPTP